MSRPLAAFAALALTLCTAAPARAWRTIEPPRIWDLTEMPVTWYAPDPDVGDVASMPSGAALELLETSFEHWWLDVPCSPLDAVYGGEVSNAGEYSHDNSTRLYFEDPAGRLGSGILGATLTWYDSSDVLTANGMNFYRTTDFDIIFNNGVNFGTPDDVYGGGCSSQYSFEAVATHEIGHGFGLGHPCEKDEACPDPLLRNAVMYWSIGACETGREIPNEDDITGINALYGIYTDFEATTETLGGLPLEVSFQVPAELDAGIDSWAWTFGDGSEPSSEAAPTHTYTEEGQYTVTLTVAGTDDECGEFEDSARKVGYVLACGTPAPQFAWSNLGDGVVQFRNTTPASTFGCIQEYEWDFGDGVVLSGYEPIHDFGDSGAWTVSLTASGPGGTETATQSVEVARRADPREDEPTVCSASRDGGGAAAGITALVAALAALGARRRSRRP